LRVRIPSGVPMERIEMNKVYQHIDVENFERISDKLYQYVVDQTDILSLQHPWNTLETNDVLRVVP